MLFLYNTLTRKKSAFHPLNPPHVGLYTCGPTVYDFAHIGHFRTYVNNDILRRVLEYNGLRVKHVMNITDVGHLTSDADTGEDKMEKGAHREGKTVWEIADFYTNDFFSAMSELNVLRPHIVCKAADHVAEMIRLVEMLEAKGYTYRLADGIYFDTSRFPRYGALTGQSFDELQRTLRAGARVEVVPGKKRHTDFALWKFSPPDSKRQMEWNSPWGVGFPGWHIECSAMSIKYLGESLDIHAGGVDHIRIHHTNEIAQSEAATGRTFAYWWFHNEFLLVNGKKMSKSLGNLFTLRDLKERDFEPMALRYLFLTAHYRKKLNFTWGALDDTQRMLTNLRERIADLGDPEGSSPEFEARFESAINDDLNMPRALAVVWDLVKSRQSPKNKTASLQKFDQVLGLELGSASVSRALEVPDHVMELVQRREELRKQQDWEAADAIRRKLRELGYEIEDSPQGPRLSAQRQHAL